MLRGELLDEVKKLPVSERLAFVEAALQLVQQDVQCLLPLAEARARRARLRARMADAAERLAQFYETDEELTAFTALDGEDIVEAR